jgi:hypothetical protein
LKLAIVERLPKVCLAASRSNEAGSSIRHRTFLT